MNELDFIKKLAKWICKRSEVSTLINYDQPLPPMNAEDGDVIIFFKGKKRWKCAILREEDETIGIITNYEWRSFP